MSTIALRERMIADQAEIRSALADGRLPLGVRGLHQLGIDVVDYSSPIEGLTQDEVTILRDTIDYWLRKGRHES